MGDKLLEGGELSDVKTGIKYREVRQYDSGTTLVKFYFVTRCYSDYVESVLNEIKTIQPHVLIMNSCLWDLHRYGPSGPVTYRNNMNKLVDAVKKIIPNDGVFIWNATMPLASKCKGGFFLPYYENIPSQEILEANSVACNAVRSSNFIFLNLHSTFTNQLHLRADDGIHWNSIAHRRISNLILHQLCRVWNLPVPCRLLMEPLPAPPTPLFGERPLSRSFSFDSNLDRYSPNVHPYEFNSPVNDRRYLVERTLEQDNASNYRDRFRLIGTPVSSPRMSSSFSTPVGNCSGFDPKKEEICSTPLFSSSPIESSSKTMTFKDVSEDCKSQCASPVVRETTPLTGTSSCLIEGKQGLLGDKPVEKQPHMNPFMPSATPGLSRDKPSSNDIKPSDKQPHMNPFMPSVTRGLLGDKPSILGDRPSPFGEKPLVFEEKPQHEDPEDKLLTAMVKSREHEVKPLSLVDKPSEENTVNKVNKEDNPVQIEERPLPSNQDVAEEKKTVASEENIKQELVEDKLTTSKDESLVNKEDTIIIIEKKTLPFVDGLAIVSSLQEDRPTLIDNKLSLSEEESSCHFKDKLTPADNKSVVENEVSTGEPLTPLKNITNQKNVPTVSMTSPLSATMPNGMEAYPTGVLPPVMAANPQATHPAVEPCHVTTQDDDIPEEHLRQMLLVSQQVNRELKKSRKIKNERVKTATCTGKSIDQANAVEIANCLNNNNQYLSTSLNMVKENDQEVKTSLHNDIKLKHTSTESCEISKKMTSSREKRDDSKTQHSVNKNTVKDSMKDTSRSNDHNPSRGLKRKMTVMSESSPRNKHRKQEDKSASKPKAPCSSTNDVPLTTQTITVTKSLKRKRSDSSSQSKRAKYEEQDHGVRRKVIMNTSVSSTTQHNTGLLHDRSKSSRNENQLSSYREQQPSSQRYQGPHIAQNAGFSIPVVKVPNTPQNAGSSLKHQSTNSMSIPVVPYMPQQYPMVNSNWTGALARQAVNPMAQIHVARESNMRSMTQQQIAQQQLMFNMALHHNHHRRSFPPVNPYMNAWDIFRSYYGHNNHK